MAKCPQGQSAKWKQPCSDEHLRDISREIAQWQDIAPDLGLSATDEVDIVGSPPRSVQAQRLAMLRIWKQRLGSRATYEELAKAFSRCRRQDLVEKISELLGEATSSSLQGASIVYIYLI